MLDKKVIGIVSFLVGVILVYMLAGAKATYTFLWLVLLGVLISNADNFQKTLKEVQK